MIDSTTRMHPRPVWARREARIFGAEPGPPTEAEQEDAIRVLEDGIRVPLSLYLEAETILVEVSENRQVDGEERVAGYDRIKESLL